MLVPALQGVLGWLAQLANDRSHSLAQLDVQLHRSDSVFLRIHELPTSVVQEIRRTPGGSNLNRRRHQVVRCVRHARWSGHVPTRRTRWRAHTLVQPVGCRLSRASNVVTALNRVCVLGVLPARFGKKTQMPVVSRHD